MDPPGLGQSTELSGWACRGLWGNAGCCTQAGAGTLSEVGCGVGLPSYSTGLAVPPSCLVAPHCPVQPPGKLASLCSQRHLLCLQTAGWTLSKLPNNWFLRTDWEFLTRVKPPCAVGSAFQEKTKVRHVLLQEVMSTFVLYFGIAGINNRELVFPSYPVRSVSGYLCNRVSPSVVAAEFITLHLTLSVAVVSFLW